MWRSSQNQRWTWSSTWLQQTLQLTCSQFYTYSLWHIIDLQVVRRTSYWREDRSWLLLWNRNVLNCSCLFQPFVISLSLPYQTSHSFRHRWRCHLCCSGECRRRKLGRNDWNSSLWHREAKGQLEIPEFLRYSYHESSIWYEKQRRNRHEAARCCHLCMIST